MDAVTGSMDFEFEAAKRALVDLVRKLGERKDSCCEHMLVQRMISDLSQARIIHGHDDIL